MTDKLLLGSLCRIADFETNPFQVADIPRAHWEAGDYVIGELGVPRGALSQIELPSGRLTRPAAGDRIVGALGVRHATLEVVGSWKEIGDDGRMNVLTAAGLLGQATSISGILPSLMTVDYRGHAMRGGEKLAMGDFARRPKRPRAPAPPTVLIIGTSMSAGKTASARIIVRVLKRAGYRVAGAKLTGAGRYRDVLAMSDAGADAIFDFVDVGLPSSVLGRDAFRARLQNLIGLIAESEPDVVVAEAGASPLEPYNGDTAVEEIRDSIRFTVLCASDPYAVVGVMRGYDIKPDLVAGLATSTTAGVEVVQKLSGIPAINMLDPSAHPILAEKLQSALA